MRKSQNHAQNSLIRKLFEKSILWKLKEILKDRWKSIGFQLFLREIEFDDDENVATEYP